jgi:hypothetical protein
MRSLIATLATLLCFNTAFAQGPQPQGAQPPAAQPSPATSEYSNVEGGRYYPCPASVRFNGRNACIGCPTPRECRVLPSDLRDR